MVKNKCFCVSNFLIILLKIYFVKFIVTINYFTKFIWYINLELKTHNKKVKKKYYFCFFFLVVNWARRVYKIMQVKQSVQLKLSQIKHTNGCMKKCKHCLKLNKRKKKSKLGITTNSDGNKTYPHRCIYHWSTGVWIAYKRSLLQRPFYLWY